MSSHLTEENKKILETQKAIDFLFEDIVQGRSPWRKDKVQYVEKLRTAIRDGFVNAESLRDSLNARMTQRFDMERVRDGDGRRRQLKDIDSILDTISADLLEMPLHVGDADLVSKDIAEERLKRGQ